MNSDTGQIIMQREALTLSMIEKAKYVPIDESLMTLKQQQEKQVSPFDNRSTLGKLRIKSRNSLRNKPCSCGSGIKFKKCCWNKTC